MTSGALPYSPGLDARYGSALARHVAELEAGQTLYWTPEGWSASGPGIEFVKGEDGFLRPAGKEKR